MEKNGDENNDVIDETKIESGDTSQYKPVKEEVIDETKIKSGDTSQFALKWRFKFKILGDISKLFIYVSFLLIAVVVLIGLYDSKFSKDVLVLLWDKLAAVYLVIFGSLLGKDR